MILHNIETLEWHARTLVYLLNEEHAYDATWLETFRRCVAYVARYDAEPAAFGLPPREKPAPAEWARCDREAALNAPPGHPVLAAALADPRAFTPGYEAETDALVAQARRGELTPGGEQGTPGEP